MVNIIGIQEYRCAQTSLYYIVTTEVNKLPERRKTVTHLQKVTNAPERDCCFFVTVVSAHRAWGTKNIPAVACPRHSDSHGSLFIRLKIFPPVIWSCAFVSSFVFFLKISENRLQKERDGRWPIELGQGKVHKLQHWEQFCLLKSLQKYAHPRNRQTSSTQVHKVKKQQCLYLSIQSYSPAVASLVCVNIIQILYIEYICPLKIGTHTHNSMCSTLHVDALNKYIYRE